MPKRKSQSEQVFHNCFGLLEYDASKSKKLMRNSHCLVGRVRLWNPVSVLWREA
jgi:hypothetical protein